MNLCLLSNWKPFHLAFNDKLQYRNNFPNLLLFFVSINFFSVEVKVDDHPVQVTLCDTAGQDFLDPLRRLCYPDSDVFLLCFSVVKPETFKSIKYKWAPSFTKSHASIVVVGTQADLRTDSKIISNLMVRTET